MISSSPSPKMLASPFMVCYMGIHGVCDILKNYIIKNIHIRKNSKLRETIKRKSAMHSAITISYTIILVPLSSHSISIEETFLTF